MVVPSWDPRWVKGLRYNFNKTNWCGYKCCIFNINLWIRENVWFVMDLYHITYEFTPTVCNELCKDVYMYFHREGEICLYLIGMYWWICTYIYIIYVLSNIPRLVSYKYIIIYIYYILCLYLYPFRIWSLSLHCQNICAMEVLFWVQLQQRCWSLPRLPAGSCFTAVHEFTDQKNRMWTFGCNTLKYLLCKF